MFFFSFASSPRYPLISTMSLSVGGQGLAAADLDVADQVHHVAQHLLVQVVSAVVLGKDALYIRLRPRPECSGRPYPRASIALGAGPPQSALQRPPSAAPCRCGRCVR